jgi:hypothetical protein
MAAWCFGWLRSNNTRMPPVSAISAMIAVIVIPEQPLVLINPVRIAAGDTARETWNHKAFGIPAWCLSQERFDGLLEDGFG